MTLYQKSINMSNDIIVKNDTTNLNDPDEVYDIHQDPFIETPWKIIESYFKNKHLECLVRHQIESYNNFINYQILRTIEMFNPIVVKCEDDYNAEVDKYSLEIHVSFENFRICRPQINENNGAVKLMFPQEARLRNFTYAGTMNIDMNIKIIVRDGEKLENIHTHYKTIPDIHIGKMPIMLKSSICVLSQHANVSNGECKYDAGGYFIISGSEKTVLGQERAAENKIYVFNIQKVTPKYSWTAEIKSVPDHKCISPKQINMYILSKNNGFGFPIVIQIPRVKEPLPLFVVFRALGVITDKEICEYILLNIENKYYAEMFENLQASIIEANKYITYDSAIKLFTSNVNYSSAEKVGRDVAAMRKQNFALEVLQNDLFPHCKTRKQKLYYLGYMANKLMMAKFGFIKEDDRDSYLNKRIDLTGTSLNNLFRNLFNRLVKDIEKKIIKEIKTGSWRSTDDYINIINLTNIYNIVKPTTIENGIKRALSTGDFGIKNTNSNKVGVAQVLNRLTYPSTLSHLRRISTPSDKSGKLVPPRKLAGSSWGFICPSETPEGGSIGIVKNLSYMAHITIQSNSNLIYDFITQNTTSIENLLPIEIFNKVKVFVNGCFIAISENAHELYMKLKDMKYKGIINVYTSIIFDYKLQEIKICNDGGRIMRPLLKVKNNNLLINNFIIDELSYGRLFWDDLLTNCKLKESPIEYIDAEEQNGCLIATKPKDIIKHNEPDIYKFTHCEIHPSTIFGILASCIPFPEFNQSPRVTYQCLDINELVLLTNGNKKPIKDVVRGDKVVCFDPETLETSYTEVIYQYVRENTKKTYKIKTISGREIIATDDHKFMTTEGWMEVKNMNINETKIGIMPYQNNVDNSISQEQIILSEEDYINFFVNRGFKMKMINKHLEQLKHANLIPLSNDNYLLPIIARMFGFVLSDGSINIYKDDNNNKFCATSFCFGTENDVKMFEEDVASCGFNKCKYNKSSRYFNNVTHTTWNVTHNGAFPALLIVLGVTYGKKTEHKRNEIPSWIMNGSKLIKREFLSGFQGGDGCKIRWNKMNKGYNFVCAETSQQINPKYRSSLKYFMEQCSSLLSEFNIDVLHVNEVIIDDNRTKISFKISDRQDNLINYFDNIGYRYASTKNISSFTIVEYLKYKQELFIKRKTLIEKVRELHDLNKTNAFIANELNIKVGNVSDFIRSYKLNYPISTGKLGKNTIENWNNKVEIINNILFQPIVSIEEIDIPLISDITVNSENHSFIAGNNFLSSNCAQGKQAMGIYATNYNERMDKTSYILNTPMRPLTDTRIMNIIKLDEIPSGCNVIVAIMTHTGYNQEDSLLLNKGSIDRGLFQITLYHTEKDEDKQQINGDEEIRCKPEKKKTKGMKMGANYDKVNNKGLIPENSLVENRDIIISKVMPIKENRNDDTKTIKYEDKSKMLKTDEETYIDKNYIDKNGEGYTFAKVRLRTTRKPTIGDKFSSRSAQKGTTGNIIPEEDMPFTADGIRPDIIINPHCIPSRMTISQLKETLLGKVLVQLGLFGDGTSFGELDVSTISKKLIQLGYEGYGNEIMYDGMSGNQFESNIFVGPVFYQRLKHMVNDKKHSRSIGPMVNLTRQPAEGRSRDGGLKFGEMEKDAMVSHGAAAFTKSRMYDVSDKYSVHVCNKCGLLAGYNDQVNIHLCKTCDNRTDFSYVQIPYSCKLLFQELMTMNVVPRMLTEK
jgi:DNA-directed RNA polymerase beta subunit